MFVLPSRVDAATSGLRNNSLDRPDADVLHSSPTAQSVMAPLGPMVLCEGPGGGEADLEAGGAGRVAGRGSAADSG